MSNFYIKNGELYHYGTQGKSGRYKWGSGDRPYQRLEGTKGFFQKMKEKKEKRASMKEAYRAKAEAKRNAKAEAKRDAIDQKFKEKQDKLNKTISKDKILTEGSKRQLLKYQSVLSTAELENAYRRMNVVTSIKNAEPATTKKGLNLLSKSAKALGDVRNINSVLNDPKMRESYEQFKAIIKLSSRFVNSI